MACQFSVYLREIPSNFVNFPTITLTLTLTLTLFLNLTLTPTLTLTVTQIIPLKFRCIRGIFCQLLTTFRAPAKTSVTVCQLSNPNPNANANPNPNANIRSGDHLETIPEIREGSGGPHEGPGVVGRPS